MNEYRDTSSSINPAVGAAGLYLILKNGPAAAFTHFAEIIGFVVSLALGLLVAAIAGVLLLGAICLTLGLTLLGADGLRSFRRYWPVQILATSALESLTILPVPFVLGFAGRFFAGLVGLEIASFGVKFVCSLVEGSILLIGSAAVTSYPSRLRNLAAAIMNIALFSIMSGYMFEWLVPGTSAVELAPWWHWIGWALRLGVASSTAFNVLSWESLFEAKSKDKIRPLSSDCSGGVAPEAPVAPGCR